MTIAEARREIRGHWRTVALGAFQVAVYSGMFGYELRGDDRVCTWVMGGATVLTASLTIFLVACTVKMTRLLKEIEDEEAPDGR